jgi:nucleoside-diphosphate-sugar epimerase
MERILTGRVGRMRVVVVGATGHIGSYLVPRLVSGGHEVIAMSRGGREPYHADRAWASVEKVEVDRDAEDRAGRFGARVAALEPDVVVDMICFTAASARLLADALIGTGTHLVHCGTIWVHGPAVEVPLREDAVRRPFGAYGTNKAQIEALLMREGRRGRLRTTVLHPGHIVGPGWNPVNPRCLGDLDTFARLATGREVVLPDQGVSMLHHVHADDVASAFELAIGQPGAAEGEAFHVVSPQAVTLHGYASAVASWFGEAPKLAYLPWDQWRAGLGDADASMAWEHLARSPCASIAKAQRLLGYRPRWSSLDAIKESLDWLVAAGRLDTGGRSLTA